MQAADTPQVERQIQRSLANESAAELIISSNSWVDPLTVNDARRIIDCLQENPRFDSLVIDSYDIHNDDVLNVFRDNLLLCSAVTTVTLLDTKLTYEDLDRLRPAFYNTSVRKLILRLNRIQGGRGGEVVRDLLIDNETLHELNLSYNRHFGLGPEVAIGFGRGLADNNRLQILHLSGCIIGNNGLAHLLPADGMINNSLLHLDLSLNRIEGAEGGRQVTLLLQRLPALKVLILDGNNLGPLGAHALALGLAAASQLKRLELFRCWLGNDGVANLVPDGQVNTLLTTLDLRGSNIEGLDGGENVIALASRCTNLDSLALDENILNRDQRRRLNLLLDRKRLCTEASTLGGSTFPVLFRFVEKAHCHEHGLSAIFVILQNDGDDYFCTLLNRAIE